MEAAELVYRPPRRPDEQGHFEMRHRPLPGWVTLIGRVGRFLLTVGLLVLAFVVYQLWGTNLQEARSQDALRGDFKQLISSAPTTPSTTAAPTTAVVPTTVKVAPTPTPAPTTTLATKVATMAPTKLGGAVAHITIDKIGVDRIVVEGVGRDELQKGPGHYTDTPMPGQFGNAAIAGHRTTFGAPFYRINELVPGDIITVTNTFGTYHYVVNALPRVVTPTDLSVLNPTAGATLTLTSCHPRFSAQQRIVITATLDPTTSDPIAVAPSAAPATTVPPVVSPGTPAVSTGPVATSVDPDPSTVVAPVGASPTPRVKAGASDEFSAGWFADSKAWIPMLAFAIVCVLIVRFSRQMSMRFSRLLTYPVAALPFVVALYFCFENLNRLLPPNI